RCHRRLRIHDLAAVGPGFVAAGRDVPPGSPAASGGAEPDRRRDGRRCAGGRRHETDADHGQDRPGRADGRRHDPQGDAHQRGRH
ncbi:hypothetical protein PHISP_08708, partial [Aspergillus sp. HF37]